MKKIIAFLVVFTSLTINCYADIVGTYTLDTIPNDYEDYSNTVVSYMETLLNFKSTATLLIFCEAENSDGSPCPYYILFTSNFSDLTYSLDTSNGFNRFCG